MDRAFTRQDLPATILLAILALAILLTVSPYLQPIPAVDSSVFLYAGQRILAGDILYRDVWDHKGPLIHFIDAAGLLVGNGSRWGVWLLELVAVLTASGLLYALAKRAFGHWPAVFGCGLFLAGLMASIHGGNMTEEYALPLQLGCLYCFHAALTTKKNPWMLAAGILAGLCILLRPNIIAIPVVIGLWCLAAARRSQAAGWKPLLTLGLGAGIPLAVAIAYFGLHGALRDMWDAVIRYNLVYTGLRQGGQFTAVRTGIQLLAGPFLLGAAGWVSALSSSRCQRLAQPADRELVLVAAAALPLELALSSLASRDYQHYLMSWLPTLSLLGSFGFFWLQKAKLQKLLKTAVIALAGILIFARFALLSSPAWQTFSAVLHARSLPSVQLDNNPYQPSLAYIYENTSPDDRLLFWGNNLALQWLSGRASPSRFAYQSPFAAPGFVSEPMVAEIIAGLNARPGLIIDTTINNDPLPALDQSLETIDEVLRPLYEFIQKNYVEVHTLFRTDWVVYAPREAR